MDHGYFVGLRPAASLAPCARKPGRVPKGVKYFLQKNERGPGSDSVWTEFGASVVPIPRITATIESAPRPLSPGTWIGARLC